MKYIIIAALVILGIGGAVFYKATHQTGSTNTYKLPSAVTIIDVRTQEEYAASHVNRAQLFPVEMMQAGQLPTLAKDAPIALYCHSGNRAGQALILMKQAGFTNVQSLGGLGDIAKYGLTMTK